MLSVTILGSGTGVPWRARAGPGLVIQAGGPEADAVLVDPSAGSIQRMAERGIPLEVLTHVVFSHYHPDHMGDLVPILFALKNPRYASRPRPLRLVGPRGLHRLLRTVGEAWGPWLESGERIQAFELGATEEDRFTTMGPLEVTAFPVIHADPSVAYRFSLRGEAAIAYSGDTDRCDGIVDAARNADLLLLECSYPEGEKRPGHLVPSEAGLIASASGARRVLLLHLYPECHDRDLLTPMREYFKGPVEVAEDGMVVRL
jgi:ribonuclease BN (tRNA processing enzyme)